MIVIVNSLVIVDSCLLIITLIPLRKLAKQLPPGYIRRKWFVLTFLILLFIIGYSAYGWINRDSYRGLTDLIVPLIFLFSSVFVFLVTSLSLQTALDVKRISRLEHESITDALTGVHNRRYLDRRLEEEVDRALRYYFPLSILLLDIDHFKRINDIYGHQVGDSALSSIGRLISESIRRSDIVARYGGEEFLVIAMHTPVSKTAGLGERLRKEVGKNVLVFPDKVDGKEAVHVTVSIGVAGLNETINDSRSLIKSADKALYQAKKAGRNRVVANNSNSPPASP